MSTLDKVFTRYIEDYNKLLPIVSNRQRLKLYALYKQALLGDANPSIPLSFKEYSKRFAWKQLQGMDKTTAKEQYIISIELLNRIL